MFEWLYKCKNYHRNARMWSHISRSVYYWMAQNQDKLPFVQKRDQGELARILFRWDSTQKIVGKKNRFRTHSTERRDNGGCHERSCKCPKIRGEKSHGSIWCWEPNKWFESIQVEIEHLAKYLERPKFFESPGGDNTRYQKKRGI